MRRLRLTEFVRFQPDWAPDRGSYENHGSLSERIEGFKLYPSFTEIIAEILEREISGKSS